MNRPVAVVVPCYNEASRLDLDGFAGLADDPLIRLVFVDDGSTDDTAGILTRWAVDRPDVSVLRRSPNAGKGEAVRAGLLHVVDTHEIVAYFDADLASPPSELRRVIDVVCREPHIDLAMGARVGLLGRDIQRKRARHWQGRVFATVSSLMLGLPVYDTQCGLKVMRSTPALRHALSTPMPTRWLFDIELLARMLEAPEPLDAGAIVEIPLRRWRDVGGSKLGLAARVGVLAELARFGIRHRRLSSRR